MDAATKRSTGGAGNYNNNGRAGRGRSSGRSGQRRRTKHDKQQQQQRVSRQQPRARDANKREQDVEDEEEEEEKKGVAAVHQQQQQQPPLPPPPPPLPPPPTKHQHQHYYYSSDDQQYYYGDHHQQHYGTSFAGEQRRDSTGSSSLIMEYSDTSGGEHQDGLVLASSDATTPSSLSSPPRQQRQREEQRSHFRRLTDTISKSMRVIRFDGSNDEGEETTSDLGSPTAYGAPLLSSQDHRHHNHNNHKNNNRRHHHHHHRRAPQQQQQHQVRHTGGTTAHHHHQQQPNNNNWMAQIALSFRSPQWTQRKTTTVSTSPSPSGGGTGTLDRRRQQQLLQHHQRRRREQHGEGDTDDDDEEEDRRGHHEATPLLKQKQQLWQGESTPTTATADKKMYSGPAVDADPYPQPENEMDYVEVAAAFLKDYEDNRPPSLPVNLTDISPWQLALHQFRFSRPYMAWLMIAVLCLFGASALEGIAVNDANKERGDSFLDKRDASQGRVILTVLNAFAVAVFGIDLWIRHELRSAPKAKRRPSYAKTMYGDYFGLNHGMSSSFLTASPIAGGSDASFLAGGTSDPYSKTAAITRPSRSQKVVKPMILFGILLISENVGRVLLTESDSSLVLMTSVFKPLILFYVSYQARNALEAVQRIIRIVSRVILMELLLILMFAAVAVRLFNYSEEFETLSRSWLSLFELSTTVVNPSLWMPMYQASHSSAIFFVFFVVVSTFYLHSLVLSVVFQTYIHAASTLHERAAADREDDVHLCFLSLTMQQDIENRTRCIKQSNTLDLDLVRRLLVVMRPHYNDLKINALMEIVESSPLSYHDQDDAIRMVDYPTFRTKIRHALNASIRTPRNATALALSVELLAIFIAIVNFIYVILVSSAFEQKWFDAWQEVIGMTITVIAAFELLVRFNPLRISDFTPLTRLSPTFDGLALLGAIISSVGIFLLAMGYETGIKTFDGLGTLDLILFGRAIDMIRIMRFFPVFRDVVRRSADVISAALFGPTVLVFTTIHLFVYLGMALWGGSVHAGSYEGKITPLYDLNNFNSYSEGIVTIFQVLVVNDWHAIAEVYLYADRCSRPVIVYTFFVMVNLIGVSIMLNCLTAFFVESFVTKINEDSDEILDTTPSVPRRGTLGNILNDSSERKSSSHSVAGSSRAGRHDFDSDADADSEGSSGSEFHEFDVYEREGFDKIMQAVSCGSQDPNFAQRICDYIEIFESLAPGREPVGVCLCDQLNLERYGNIRFQTMAAGFLTLNDLHVVVTDMHAELLAMASRTSSTERSLIRSFPHADEPHQVLEISAALIRRHPALSLFVSRIGTSHN